MSPLLNMDARFLDRCGCGDELHNDFYLKSAAWFADLHGSRGCAEPGVMDTLDEDCDEPADH